MSHEYTSPELALIESHNLKLLRTLKDLKSSSLPTEQRDGLLKDANEILYTAIRQFPHIVHSVVVGLNLTTNSLPNSYIYNRYAFEHLIKQRQLRGDSDPTTLVVPLPYSFTTGTHGSGERAAMGASKEEIMFQLTLADSATSYDEPAIAVVIKAPLVFYDYTLFRLSEIESLELSPRTDFTPFIDIRNQNGVLKDRAHFLAHYLGFRNFRNKGVGNYLPGEIKPVILNPDFLDQNLWQHDWKKSRLKKGFFIVYDPSVEKTVMFEVDNYPLEASAREDRIAEMVVEVLSLYELEQSLQRNPLQGLHKMFRKSPHFITYKGNAIIERLFQLPVQDRHF